MSLVVRHSLLGNSLDVTSVAVLVLPLLQKWGCVPETLGVNDVIYPTPRRSLPAPDVRLIRACLSCQGHGGGRLRQESRFLNNLTRPALQAIKADQWESRTFIRAEWQLPEERIDTLKARGYILMLKWRGCTGTRHCKTFLHLTDSQVYMGAFLMHRSPAYMLNFLTQRAAALELAFSLNPVRAFGRTRQSRTRPSTPRRSSRLSGEGKTR